VADAETPASQLAVPRLYSLDGQLRVESASVAGRWLEPAGVIF
jgi:hypothetical protein